MSVSYEPSSAAYLFTDSGSQFWYSGIEDEGIEFLETSLYVVFDLFVCESYFTDQVKVPVQVTPIELPTLVEEPAAQFDVDAMEDNEL